MKYSILGFSQPALIENNIQCDLTDLVLLNYIMYAQANPKMLHTMDENNIPHVWLSHKKILEDLPILNISAGTLKNRILSLKEKEYISSVVRAYGKGRGSMAFYAVSPLIYDIRYETTRLKKDDLKPRPGVKKSTSNDDTGIKNVTPNNPLVNNNISNIDKKEVDELKLYQEELKLYQTAKAVDAKASTLCSTENINISSSSTNGLDKVDSRKDNKNIKEKINQSIEDIVSIKEERNINKDNGLDTFNKETQYKLSSGKVVNKTTKSPNYLKDYIINLHDIDGVEVNGKLIHTLLQWYYTVGIGSITIRQLEKKLSSICSECDRKLDLIIAAIDKAYINDWKAFYPSFNSKNKSKSDTSLILNNGNNFTDEKKQTVKKDFDTCVPF